MPIDPTTSTTATTGAASLTATAKKSASFMGKEDFLKLLMAQLRNQDPSNAQDMEGMTQQMTQFSMLEQLTNLAEATEASSVSLARTHAVELLGRTVSYKTASGEVKEGVVGHVNVTGSAPRLTVGSDTNLLLADVVSVRP
ncbi:MAG TPA: flagellar hook capping FlgD N-terminal domain-containing protein [Solirubrobacteraceae bacterium]|jgi:flagellar basal-body rod modification protein FlgD|nr:flagellar hook capping FlgD N-terminal domain-containing protein [Solirubrobacteraceae bacterium]